VCGASGSLISIPSCSAFGPACFCAGLPLTWSKSSSKVYEPAQNASVRFHVNAKLLALLVKASTVLLSTMPALVATPSATNVVRPELVQFPGRGPIATSVFAVALVTGLVEIALAQGVGGVM